MWERIARHALSHGYRPPPRPRSVREALVEIIATDTAGAPGPKVDAILARFDVRRRDEQP